MEAGPKVRELYEFIWNLRQELVNLMNTCSNSELKFEICLCFAELQNICLECEQTQHELQIWPGLSVWQID